MHVPMQALQYRVIRFLKEVTLADLIVPGRRIDVPREVLDEQCSCRRNKQLNRGQSDEMIVLDLAV
jgi:hypothetical protein